MYIGKCVFVVACTSELLQCCRYFVMYGRYTVEYSFVIISCTQKLTDSRLHKRGYTEKALFFHDWFSFTKLVKDL